MPLTQTERNMLTIESQWWRHWGAKEQAMRDQCDMSATAYHLALSRLIDREDAMAHSPLVVKTLRSRRASRQRGRGARSWEVAS